MTTAIQAPIKAIAERFNLTEDELQKGEGLTLAQAEDLHRILHVIFNADEFEPALWDFYLRKKAKYLSINKIKMERNETLE